jgi:hypothetical protein
MIGYDTWKLRTPPEYDEEAPEPCGCCGVHDRMPPEEGADEDGRYVTRHEFCEMCTVMSCEDNIAECGVSGCRCRSCGARGVETLYEDKTLCVDCDAFRERSLLQLLSAASCAADAGGSA